jgi:hypothetical protein
MFQKWIHLVGTTATTFGVGLAGFLLKFVGGQLVIRNADDSADVTIAPESLGSGTADATTVLYGDNTWGVPSGGASAVYNVLPADTTVPTDQSMVVVGRLDLNGFRLTVNGHLGIM